MSPPLAAGGTEQEGVSGPRAACCASNLCGSSPGGEGCYRRSRCRGTGSLVVAQRTFSPGEQNSPARQSPRAGCAAGALWPDPAFCWRCQAGGSPSNPFRPATVCCRTSSPCLRAPALTEGRHLGLQHNDRASAPLTPCPRNGHDRPPGLHIPHALRASVCPVGVPADAPVTRRSIALRLVRRCALRWVYLMLSRFGWV